MHTSITRCESCGAPPRPKDVCCFYCGTPWGSSASQGAKTPSARNKIKADCATYSELNDIELRGDCNTIGRTVNCKIVGDCNSINQAIDCEIKGDSNTVRQATRCQIKGDSNVVQAG